MSAFTALRPGDSGKKPRHVRVLPPSAFSETWEKRPHGPVKIGLRTISENEWTAALSMAASTAWETLREEVRESDEDLLTEIYNDHVITNVLARACVQAEDISKPFFAPAPEALIRAALTPGGIRCLWDEYSTIRELDCPIGAEASAEDIAVVVARVGDLETIPAGSAARIRRLLAVVKSELDQHG